jgi:hypothetical protein
MLAWVFFIAVLGHQPALGETSMFMINGSTSGGSDAPPAT